MMKRFSQLVSAFSDASAACENGAGCKCCAAISKAREQALYDPLPDWNSPLTPGVQLSNLSHSEDKSNLRVDLAEDWARMFQQLPAIGPALVMTRNGGAVLGRRMAYPDLAITSGGCKAASGEGGLLLEFGNFGMARALHRRRQIGHLFGVEFTDHADNIIHRFTLTPESDMDEFFAWVRLHQACSAHWPDPLFSEDDHAAIRDRTLLWRQCDGDALTSIVAATVDRGIPLRATVRNSAVTQRVDMAPVSLQPSDEWWFISDDETGLHFYPDYFTNIILDKHAGEHGGTRIVLKAITGDGTPGLLLEASQPAAEDAWRELLEAVV